MTMIHMSFTILGKLENLTVSSKFFKETSASEVFGDEPVKRTDKKLREIQEKLKHFVIALFFI